MLDADSLKATAWRAIRTQAQPLQELALRILQHPELGYAETQASAWLCDELARHGFDVQRPWPDVPTAFLAERSAAPSASPRIAFLAEYDALPDVGHGCGHNLIGPAAVGAAIGAATALAQTGGRVCVIGTPAEEFANQEEGKVKLLRAGAFANLDAALMLHPHLYNQVMSGDLGFVACEWVFHGRPAHAAADPWNGLNALDGLLAAFNNVALLRQQLRPEVRVHGIITDGGQVPNIIPVRAAARWMVRAPDPVLLEQVYARVLDCARAGALASGTQVDIHHITTVYNTRINPTLNRLFVQNMEQLGSPVTQPPLQMGGSTDFGNVSQVLPAAMYMIKTHPSGLTWHSTEVAEGSGQAMALEGMMMGACALAGVAIDLLSAPALLEQARQDFEHVR